MGQLIAPAPFTKVKALHARQVPYLLQGIPGNHQIPITLTGLNDATNYVLKIQPIDAANGRACQILSPTGVEIFRVDATGVKASSDGVTPASPIGVSGDASNKVSKAGDTMTGTLVLNASTPFNAAATSGTTNIELGRTGSTDTPRFDFHSSGTGSDYDARIQASGGTSNAGFGVLTITAQGGINFVGPISFTDLTVTGDLTVGDDISVGDKVTGDLDITGACEAAGFTTAGEVFANTGITTDGFIICDSLRVGNTGNAVLTQVFSATQSWDPSSLSAGSNAVNLVTVVGAAVGDLAFASLTTATEQQIQLTAHVTATDTVAAVLQNIKSTSVDLSSGTLRVWVLKFT
jgi:hypothetical protein